MALTMLTALEIFTNPRDLSIRIGRSGGKWGFAISRGPGNHFKALVDSEGFAENKEGAILVLKEMLEAISSVCTKALEDQGDGPSQYILLGQQIDQSRVLNSELIGQIIVELDGASLYAKTYRMLTPTS